MRSEGLEKRPSAALRPVRCEKFLDQDTISNSHGTSHTSQPARQPGGPPQRLADGSPEHLRLCKEFPEEIPNHPSICAGDLAR